MNSKANKKKIAIFAQVMLYIYAAIHIIHVIVWVIKPLRFWSYRTFQNIAVTGADSCFVSRGVFNMLLSSHNKAIYKGEIIETTSIAIWIILAVAAIAVAVLIKKKVSKVGHEEEYLFTCSKCNTKLKEFTKFCPNCSAPSSDFIMKM